MKIICDLTGRECTHCRKGECEHQENEVDVFDEDE